MSELHANRPICPAPTTSDDPQSSGQSAGFGGGAHECSTMSHRALSVPIAQETFVDGVLNHAGDETTTSEVVVVGAAVVEVDDTVVVEPDADPPPPHAARPTATPIVRATPTATFRTRGPYVNRLHACVPSSSVPSLSPEG